MRAPPRRVSAPGPSCPRAAARRSFFRGLARGPSGRRCRTERARHSRARHGRCAEPPRERYFRPATSARANVRLGPRADAARRLAAVTAVRARPPGLRNYPRHSRWIVPFAVPVSRRGVERDPQCHGTRVRLHGSGANRERVPSVLGRIRDPRFLAHATVSARDRAVSTHPVPGYASPDSARVARRLRRDDLGGVRRTDGVWRLATVVPISPGGCQTAHRRTMSSPPNQRLTRTAGGLLSGRPLDRKSTRLNSSHLVISYAVFCLKKKKEKCDISKS